MTTANKVSIMLLAALVCALPAAALAQIEETTDPAAAVTDAQEPEDAAPALFDEGEEFEEEPAMSDYPVVKLRSLDKVTARTMTFEAEVGSTVKFGGLYIKVRSCRKASPLEQPESASFMQIWEITPEDKAEWVFSGWMFASSPGLSAMDHPIYDVWVLDCLEQSENQAKAEPAAQELEAESEAAEEARAENTHKDGIVKDHQVPQKPKALIEE